MAHYVSLFLVQGQFAIPLLSDPLGRGWDLFGTADVIPDLTVISRRTSRGTSSTERSPPGTWPGWQSRTIAR